MAAKTARMRSFSPQEYLMIERQADDKSEYLNGEIFAMASASKEHNRIVTNVVGELHQQLKGRPCNTYANDMRVNVSATGFYTYPDVLIVCGPEQFVKVSLLVSHIFLDIWRILRHALLWRVHTYGD